MPFMRRILRSPGSSEADSGCTLYKREHRIGDSAEDSSGIACFLFCREKS